MSVGAVPVALLPPAAALVVLALVERVLALALPPALVLVIPAVLVSELVSPTLLPTSFGSVQAGQIGNASAHTLRNDLAGMSKGFWAEVFSAHASASLYQRRVLNRRKLTSCSTVAQRAAGAVARLECSVPAGQRAPGMVTE